MKAPGRSPGGVVMSRHRIGNYKPDPLPSWLMPSDILGQWGNHKPALTLREAVYGCLGCHNVVRVLIASIVIALVAACGDNATVDQADAGFDTRVVPRPDAAPDAQPDAAPDAWLADAAPDAMWLCDDACPVTSRLLACDGLLCTCSEAPGCDATPQPHVFACTLGAMPPTEWGWAVCS